MVLPTEGNAYTISHEHEKCTRKIILIIEKRTKSKKESYIPILKFLPLNVLQWKQAVNLHISLESAKFDK